MNLNEKPIREKYKDFYGSNTEKMELLIKDKRIPMTTKQIIERRLNSEQEDWRRNYFDTCDAVVYGKNGKFKIIKNCNKLKEMNSKTKLKKGAIKISKKFYDSIDCEEFSKETDKEVIWKYLIEELYNKYIKLIDYCPIFYVTPNDNYTLRAWYVCGLEGRSSAEGWSDLGDDFGRLLGIASEMLDKLSSETEDKE